MEMSLIFRLSRMTYNFAAILLEVVKAERERVDRTITAELPISRIGENMTSPAMSRAIAPIRVNARYFSM